MLLLIQPNCYLFFGLNLARIPFLLALPIFRHLHQLLLCLNSVSRLLKICQSISNLPIIVQIINSSKYQNSKLNKYCHVLKNTEKASDLPGTLSTPACRALAQAGVEEIEPLTKFSETEVGKWHGIGPNALDKLQQALNARGLAFAEDNSVRTNE